MATPLARLARIVIEARSLLQQNFASEMGHPPLQRKRASSPGPKSSSGSVTKTHGVVKLSKLNVCSSKLQNRWWRKPLKRRTKPLSKHVKERASKARPMSYAEILTERHGRLMFPRKLPGARINSLQVAEETCAFTQRCRRVSEGPPGCQ